MASTRDGGSRGDDGRRDGPRTAPPALPGASRLTEAARANTRPRPEQPRTAGTGRPTEPRTGGPAAPPDGHGDGPGSLAGRLLGRPLRWLGWGLLATVPLLLLAVGLVYVKLIHGAIPLRFVVEPIQQALEAELGGIRVAIENAELAHNKTDGALELKLIGVELTGAEAGMQAKAAEALVGLDMAALWSGRVAAERIVLIEPRLTLTTGGSSGIAVPAPATEPPNAALSLPVAAQSGSAAAGPKPPQGQGLQRFDLARGLAELVAHLRRGGEAASHLKLVGARKAAVVIDDGQRHALWLVPEIEVNLAHRQKRSVIIGTARVAPGAAGTEPFAVAFRLEDSEKAKSLRLECQVSRLVPRGLARNLPALGPLDVFDMPVSATGWLDLTTAGEIVGGRFDVETGEGRLILPKLAGLPLGLDKSRLALIYHGETRRLELAPSVIEMDGSRVKLAGNLAPFETAGAQAGWQLELQALEGALVNAPGEPPLAIERLALRSRHWPATGAAELEAFSFKAGGAEIDVTGALPGPGDSAGASLDGRIGAMSVQTLKEVWPTAFAPRLRGIVARSLVKGQLKGGAFKIATSGAAKHGEANAGASAGAGTGRFSLALEGHDLGFGTAAGLPLLTVPRALLRIEGSALEITVPDASIAGADGRKLLLKGGHLAIADMDQPHPVAEITGRALGPLGTVLEIAGREAIGLIKTGTLPAGVDGKIEAQWRASLPLADKIEISDIRLDGKIKVSDGRVPDVLGKHDLTGASFTIGATEKALDIKGEMLLAGVPIKTAGQWIIGEDKASQPPLSITAKLDGADRRQLGLDIEEFVQGEVPLELLFWPGQGERGKLQVNADLTGAELMIEGIAWKKPSGRSAKLAFDVVRPRTGKGLELQAFKLAGDSITIDGTVVIGPDNKAQSYNFPGFSLNVVSNLEVQGVRRADRTWDVKAHGKTFDGSELMRSLYAVSQKAERKPEQKGKVLELVATIDTVLGLNEGTLKQVRVQLRKQDEEIRALHLRGVLDGGSPLEVTLAPAPGQPRIVHARTSDTGQALKLIGFYSSMIGGQGDLRVNLDGRGSAERSGEIAVKRFRVLGDAVVSEVLQGVDDSRPAIAQGGAKRDRRIVREQIEFETLSASFASGNGQLALESASAAGPLMGATLRGKVDFRSRRLSLGGTYVPLSGLNRALSALPLFGELLTGPRGDGVFGITFAIDGPMEQPQVIVNPFSMVAPGVLREIFQMAPEAPRVTPATDTARPPAAGSGARVRASPPAAINAPGPAGPGVHPKVLDGWSSESTRSGAARGAP